MTYVALANITLGSSASSVTFSSIPATFRDLVLIINGKSTDSSNGDFRVRFNGDSSSIYSAVRAGGVTTITFSDTTTTTGLLLGLGFGSNSNGVAVLQVMDYSATDKHKTTLLRDQEFSGTAYVGMRAGRYASTSALTTLEVTAVAGSLAAASTFALYGIAS